MTTKDDYVASIKATFVSFAEKSIMGYLVAQFPLLANPFFGGIVQHYVHAALMSLANSAEMGAFFVYTDFRVNQQGNDFVSAALKNHQIQLSGTPEEKANAEKELFDKFAAFVTITN